MEEWRNVSRWNDQPLTMLTSWLICSQHTPLCQSCSQENEFQTRMFFCPELMNALNKEDLMLAFNIMWDIWKSRNAMIFQSKQEQPQLIYQTVLKHEQSTTSRPTANEVEPCFLGPSRGTTNHFAGRWFMGHECKSNHRYRSIQCVRFSAVDLVPPGTSYRCGTGRKNSHFGSSIHG